MKKEDQMMDIKVMLMTVIALTALLGGQGFIMSLLLDPVKQSQARMEKHMSKMEAEMEKRMGKMEKHMSKMEAGMEKRMGTMETKIGTMETKVDKLLAQKNL